MTRKETTARRQPPARVQPAQPAGRAASRAWAVGLGAVAITVVAYAQVWRFDFVSFDDQVYVTGNPMVRAGLTWAGIVSAFTGTYAANWHPVTWLSHMLDVELFGLNSGPHHVVNLLLHAANTLLVWLVLRRMTGSVYRSALVAALFGVHPLHVESVAWVAERKDVLSTCFALLTFWYYAGYVQRKTTWRYAAALVCFALGLMAKPMLVTLPMLLLLLDFWPLRRMAGLTNPAEGDAPTPWRRILWDKAPFFALSALTSVATVIAQQRGGAMATLDVIPLGVRAANALIGYAMYLWTTVWPVRLAALYPHEPSPSMTMAIAGGVVLIGITITIVRTARTQPYLAVGWFWFVGTLVPVSGVMQVGFQARADRFTYLPHIGLFVAIVWGLAALASRWQVPRRAVAVAALTVVVVLAGTTRIQAGYWRDGVTLWERAVAVTKPSGRTYSNLGASLAGAGRHAEAVTAYRQASGSIRACRRRTTISGWR